MQRQSLHLISAPFSHNSLSSEEKHLDSGAASIYQANNINQNIIGLDAKEQIQDASGGVFIQTLSLQRIDGKMIDKDWCAMI